MGFAQLSGGRSRRALALALCVWSLISLSCAARLTDSSRQKLDVQKHLNRLNKPAVKSIKVSFFSLSLLLYIILSSFNFLAVRLI